MRRDTASKAKRQQRGEGGGTPPSAKTSSADIAAGAADGRHVQVSFRVRHDLKVAILDEAHRRRMTLQAFILVALREQGVPVLESDLEDLRLGAPRRDGTVDSGRSDLSATHPARARSTPPTYAGDLGALTTLLAAAILRSGSAQPSNIVVTNCGCGAPERSGQPAKPHNAKRKDTRE